MNGSLRAATNLQLTAFGWCVFGPTYLSVFTKPRRICTSRSRVAPVF